MKGTILALAALVVAAALAVAGCGGGGGNSSAGYGNEGGGSGEPASSSASSTGATAITVAGASGVGRVLVDSNGMTIYYFEKDRGGKSSCYAACARNWPPVTTSSAAQAGEGAQAAKLGTSRRNDGTTQVTYAGWPLYTFVGDKKPGEANGTDVKAFGASWYPLSASGAKAGD